MRSRIPARKIRRQNSYCFGVIRYILSEPGFGIPLPSLVFVKKYNAPSGPGLLPVL